LTGHISCYGLCVTAKALCYEYDRYGYKSKIDVQDCQHLSSLLILIQYRYIWDRQK